MSVLLLRMHACALLFCRERKAERKRGYDYDHAIARILLLRYDIYHNWTDQCRFHIVSSRLYTLADALCDCHHDHHDHDSTILPIPYPPLKVFCMYYVYFPHQRKSRHGAVYSSPTHAAHTSLSQPASMPSSKPTPSVSNSSAQNGQSSVKQ